MARSIKTIGEDGSAHTVTFVTDAICSADDPELISATSMAATETDMLEESFDEEISSTATNSGTDDGGVPISGESEESSSSSSSTPRQIRRHLLAISPTSWAEVQREAPALQPNVSPSSVTAMSSLTAALEVDSVNNTLVESGTRNSAVASSVDESRHDGNSDLKSDLPEEHVNTASSASDPNPSDSEPALTKEILGAAYHAALREDGAGRIQELHALGHNMNMMVDARTPLQAAAWCGHTEVSDRCKE